MAAEEEAGGAEGIAEEDVEYECVICGARVRFRTLEMRGGYIRCPNQHCRSRILRKVRPLGIKHVRCD